tara:strand:- start:542 stop:772 length:231 start_codon:yes stop_codon:yes gene_type:complete
MDKHQGPWNLTIEDKNYQEEPWILKKGKDSVTIQKSKIERGKFNLQKNKERNLSLNLVQTDLSFHQLIEFGYKLQK